jgi:hypothetical protein
MGSDIIPHLSLPVSQKHFSSSYVPNILSTANKKAIYPIYQQKLTMLLHFKLSFLSKVQTTVKKYNTASEERLQRVVSKCHKM